MNNQKIIGIVSGYFNPIHLGHIQYINEAKKLCDYLICIVNNDHQVELKNSTKFMDQQHRLEIIRNLRSVDEGIISIDTDHSVSETIGIIAKNILSSKISSKIIFFNSGDRSDDNQNLSEIKICNKYNIEKIFINLPKIYSSSLLKRNSTS